MQEREFVARLAKALDLAERVVEEFGECGYEDAESISLNFRPQKAISETAMLLLAASGAERFPEIAVRIDRLAPRIAPLARSAENALRMTLNPGKAVEFASAHALLTRLGYRDSVFDRIAREALGCELAEGSERPPYAEIERRWIGSLLGISGDCRNWRVLEDQSVLAHPIDTLAGDREDLYAFTHLLIYLTDFGLTPAFLPRSRDAMLAEADGYLARCLDRDDFDLAGELLLAWPYLGEPWSPTARFAVRVLMDAEDRAGLLPGGTTRADRLRRLGGIERTRYALATGYHTAYVMGLLCAAALLPDAQASPEICESPSNAADIDRLLPLLDDRHVHWRSTFDALSPAEQQSLAPMLLDIAALRAHQRSDFSALLHALDLGVSFGLPPTPVQRQAAALLTRLANCSAYLTGPMESDSHVAPTPLFA